MAECDGKCKPEDQKSGCGDAYQLIRDLNLVSAGIIASYFLEVMRSSGSAAPLHVLEGPGSPHFLSALGTSVVIAGSAVLIPVFWERYFSMLRDCCSCRLWLEVLYSSAALLIPVAALLIAAGPPEWGGALGLRARYVAAAYVSAALPIVALRLRWNWWCERQTASPHERSRCATCP